MKAGTQDKLKYKKLLKKLKISRPHCTGLLEEMWHFTASNCPRGDIGRFSNEDIAVSLDWDGDPDELVAALTHCKWLDFHPIYRLVVHDWHMHAPNYVKANLNKRGVRFAVNDENVGDVASQVELGASQVELGASQVELGASQVVLEATTKPSQAKPSQFKPSQAKDGGPAAAGGGGILPGEDRKPEIDRECFRISEVLFPNRHAPCRKRDEREFIFRVATLRVLGEIPESVIAGTLDGAAEELPRNPIRFFRSGIYKRADEDHEINATELLARVQIPPWAESMIEPGKKIVGSAT